MINSAAEQNPQICQLSKSDKQNILLIARFVDRISVIFHKIQYDVSDHQLMKDCIRSSLMRCEEHLLNQVCQLFTQIDPNENAETVKQEMIKFISSRLHFSNSVSSYENGHKLEVVTRAKLKFTSSQIISPGDIAEPACAGSLFDRGRLVQSIHKSKGKVQNERTPNLQKEDQFEDSNQLEESMVMQQKNCLTHSETNVMFSKQDAKNKLNLAQSNLAQSGVSTMQESANYLQQQKQQAKPIEWFVDRVFEKYDDNKSGSLDYRELQKFLRDELQGKYTHFQFMQVADIDKQGLISKEQLSRFFAKYGIKMKNIK